MKSNLPSSKEFVAGTVFSTMPKCAICKLPKYQELCVKYPSRLEAISLDPSKIAEQSADNIYTAGQIDFCIDVFNEIHIKTNENGTINIGRSTLRKSLVLHSARLMQKATGCSLGFDIDVKSNLDFRHCGLGSSSSIIQGVAAAINELFGCPIKPLDLIHYLISNHGEEIKGNDEKLIQVQSVGGSGICGHYKGGLIINAGKAVPIFCINLPEDYKVVLGIPKSFNHPDSNTLMNKELENMDGFKNTGKKYSYEVAYRLVHEAMPGLVIGDYKPCKDLIFDYRWDMGSIKNCSFVCPEINEIAEKLRPLKNDKDIEFISLSSVGPGFFAITKNPTKAVRIFSGLKMNTFTANIYNGKYKITKKVLWS